MFHVFTRFLLPALALTLLALIQCEAQTPTNKDAWGRANACQITFEVPKNLKNRHVKGIDSCVAEFRGNKLRLAIEASSLFQDDSLSETETMSNFTMESVAIGGKKVQIATYKDNQTKSRRRFRAQLYVTLHQAKPNEWERSVHLLISIEGESENEMEIAKLIFHSVRFEPYHPFMFTW